jgi:hypothetical protein
MNSDNIITANLNPIQKAWRKREAEENRRRLGKVYHFPHEGIRLLVTAAGDNRVTVVPVTVLTMWTGERHSDESEIFISPREGGFISGIAHWWAAKEMDGGRLYKTPPEGEVVRADQYSAAPITAEEFEPFPPNQSAGLGDFEMIRQLFVAERLRRVLIQIGALEPYSEEEDLVSPPA